MVKRHALGGAILVASLAGCSTPEHNGPNYASCAVLHDSLSQYAPPPRWTDSKAPYSWNVVGAQGNFVIERIVFDYPDFCLRTDGSMICEDRSTRETTWDCWDVENHPAPFPDRIRDWVLIRLILEED